MYIEFHVLAKITDNFSEAKKVGSGGYGDVYKAVYNGEEIAVKKFHSLHGLDNKVFDSEYRNVSMVHHRNVVRLIGYSFESRHKYVTFNGELIFAKEVERILCFEYMQGGSLDKHISDESCDLNWRTCYKIIRGTCEGLNHLHNGHTKPILHLDLKPANILLDNNKTAKIADLGLSRFVSSSGTRNTEIVHGTYGYMPPEYTSSGDFSTKFDMFSLGVIIIKIMAGNEGYPRCKEMPHEEFVELVTENWKERLGTYLSQEIDILRVKKCVGIALRCVELDRNRRPCIKDVITDLEKLEAEVNEMSPSSDHSEELIIESLSLATRIIKSELYGGSAGFPCDIGPQKPRRLESVTIVHLGLLDTFSFSYTDEAGEIQNVGPWGQDLAFKGYGNVEPKKIEFGPSEYLKEVSGTYGCHFEHDLVMALTFVTNIRTYGPFGNPNHQNVPATYFKFTAGDDRSIVGFHGRSGKFLFSIGFYEA